MSDLHFSLEWEDPAGARGDELRATWCRLAIECGGQTITELHDDRSQSVRTAVYGPAYPLAEWFVYHWWPLLHEVDKPAAEDAASRHNIRSAREGFSLPDLEFYSEGSLIRAVWNPSKPAATSLRFLGAGFAFIDRTVFRARVEEFIAKVVARLKALKVESTPLEKEWTALNETPESETEFCEVAGALGLDPYALDNGTARTIVKTWEILPKELRKEFFLAATPGHLKHQTSWIRRCLNTLEDYSCETALAGKKGIYHHTGGTVAPWREGYELARQFRRDEKLGGIKAGLSLEKLCRARQSHLPVVLVSSETGFDAVAKLDDQKGPQVATSKSHEAGKKYHYARILCDYLCAHANDGVAVLADVKSNQQKRNRAFAAELLAPAKGISRHLSASCVSLEEVSEIALEYNVSDLIVLHQIKNHELGTIRGFRAGLFEG